MCFHVDKTTSSCNRFSPVGRSFPRPGCNSDCGADGRTVAVDAEARLEPLTTAARNIRRHETARTLVDDFRSKIETAQSVALPSSALSKACHYALTLWKKLTHFLEYPELELSTNLVENSMRPVALGRENWIHIGSPLAGPKVAAILSVVEGCRRLKIPVRDYFSAILAALADLPTLCRQSENDFFGETLRPQPRRAIDDCAREPLLAFRLADG